MLPQLCSDVWSLKNEGEKCPNCAGILVRKSEKQKMKIEKENEYDTTKNIFFCQTSPKFWCGSQRSSKMKMEKENEYDTTKNILKKKIIYRNCKYAEICWNSKSLCIRTYPDASGTHPGRIRDASGIGTSSAEICTWPRGLRPSKLALSAAPRATRPPQ